MLRITIGTWDRRYSSFNQINERELTEQVRRGANERACIQVTIEAPDVNMTVSAGNCRSGGGCRSPNRRERQIFDKWNRMV